jgi:hypothetical protein
MTARKKDNVLRGDRTPAYVDRVIGAAELVISADTWDQWVKEGILPAPCDTLPAGVPRWRWEDVDRKLSGKNDAGTDAAVRGAANFGRKTNTEASVRGGLNSGKKRGRPRTATIPPPPTT